MYHNPNVTCPGVYLCVYAHSGWFTKGKTYTFYEGEEGVLYTTSNNGYEKPLKGLASKFQPVFESLEELL